MHKLFKVHANNDIGIWKIWYANGRIYMESSRTIDAKPVVHSYSITQGKAGRSLQQQIELEINSKISSKMDSGYCRTEGEAVEKQGQNAANLPRPMLAARDVKGLANASAIYVQPKLDGMRLIIANVDGDVIAYTRNGKRIYTVPHILDDAAAFLNPGEFLDGELYSHGVPLQKIMSWAKREQPENANLRFHLFDVIDDAPFDVRFMDMEARIAGIERPSIHVVATNILENESQLPLLLHNARENGYEGLILRDADAPYQIGKRAKALVKVKQFLDDEFICREVTTGERGLAVLVCETNKGQMFRVTAPGTHVEKQWALENPEFFINHMVTVRYAGLTPKGIPFHPVCLGRKD